MELSPSTYESVTSQYEAHPGARLGVQVAARFLEATVEIEDTPSTVTSSTNNVQTVVPVDQEAA